MGYVRSDDEVNRLIDAMSCLERRPSMAETRRIGGHAWDKATSTLTVWIDGVRHQYSNVSFYWAERFEFAATKNFGRAMAILRKMKEVKEGE